MFAQARLRMLASGLACFSAGICATARGQSFLIDGFNDGNDDGWSHLCVPDNPVWGPCGFNASSGVYHWTSGVIQQGDVGIMGAYWWDISNPLFSDGFLRVKVRNNSANTDVGLFMRMQPCIGSSYIFFARPEGMLEVFKLDDCDGEGPPMCPQRPGGLQPGEWWILEAGAIGNQLTLRAWPADQEPPGEPQVYCVDAESEYSMGGFGLVAVHQEGYASSAIDVEFDDVTFTPACPGDVTLDKAVDLSDLTALLSHFGESCDPVCPYVNGNVNYDGNVDLDDLTRVLAHFGTTCD